MIAIGLFLRARGLGAEPEARERAGYARPMPAPHADAYHTGGVPLRGLYVITAQKSAPMPA